MVCLSQQLFLVFACKLVFYFCSHYPVVEPPPGASGTLLNIGTNLCLDGGFGGSGSPIKISSCSQDSSEMVSGVGI